MVAKFREPSLNGQFWATALTALLVLVAVAACNKDKASEGAEADKASEEARKVADKEAVDMLDRLYKSAAIYYSTPHVERGTGNKVPCQFPSTTEWTPAADRCKQADKRLKAPGEWASETWSALNFVLRDKHFAQYRVVSNGKTIGEAQIQLQARYDHDCDGKYTVLTRTAKADPTTNRAECLMDDTDALSRTEE